MSEQKVATGLIDRLYRRLDWAQLEPLRRKATRLVYGKMHRIDDLRSARQNADLVALRNQVRASGTDSVGYFANGYTHEGDLFLQQNPDEFAALCLLLRRYAPIHNYLEIGSASGGACRFIYENVGFDRGISLDDGRHARAVEQDRNFSHVPNLTRFVGDSHSPEARRFLVQNLAETIDVAFIDGDHSYEGVWADIRLALAFSRPGTIFVFHDTIACDGVEQAWLELIQRGVVKALAEYVGDDHPLGIAVGAVK